jgi:hypothetical protein
VKDKAKSKLARASWRWKDQRCSKPRSDKGLIAGVPVAEMMKSPIDYHPLERRKLQRFL